MNSLYWQIYHLREVAGKAPEIEEKNLEWVLHAHWWFQADWNKHHTVTSQHYAFLLPGKRELPAVMCYLAAHCGAWEVDGEVVVSDAEVLRGRWQAMAWGGLLGLRFECFSIERESGEGIFCYDAWNAKELSFQVLFASKTVLLFNWLETLVVSLFALKESPHLP